MDQATTVENASIIVLAIKFAYLVVIVFIPLYLVRSVWKKWVTYVRAAFFAKQKKILLELRIPRGIAKSPLSMELFLTTLNQTGGEGTNYDKFWLGKTRAWFSLEMISIDGQVRFLIWTRESWKALLESQLYSQFADIEIEEVPDYAYAIPFNFDEYQMWACDFKKSKDSHYPIKTYINYGLDKDPDEEIKIDPITSTLEFMASMGKGEQLWVQIGVRAHKDEMPKPGGKWGEKVDWKHAANEEIKKLMKRDVKPKEGELKIPELSMTKGEKEKIEAIERNISKIAFDCGIRAIYIAEKDKFRGTNAPGITGMFKQYNVSGLNGFSPQNATAFDYPWQDFSGKKTKKKKLNMLYLFQHRYFFYPSFFPEHYDYTPFVMTTEELATVYHFPGDSARTPSISRVTAKKVEPPQNLPI